MQTTKLTRQSTDTVRTHSSTLSPCGSLRTPLPASIASKPQRRDLSAQALLLIRVVAILCLIGLPACAEELTVDRIFDANRMIEVSIQLPSDDWDALRKQSRDPRKAFSGSQENPFTYFRGDVVVDGVAIGSVGVRKKGFLGSLDDRFPSLKIKFDEFVDQTPTREFDGLTLNNNKQDTSLVSQFLAYELYNAAGVRAPRCNFARVTVNGQYLGVYTNVEAYGKPFLQRRFGNRSGNLYEGTLADFYPKAIERLEAKTNRKNHDRSQALQLANLLADDGPLALDKVEQLLDLDNFLRFWSMESLIGYWDGYTNNQNNFFVYQNPADDKFYFMPWGTDAAFTPPPNLLGVRITGPVSVQAQSMLTNRLYHDEQIALRYRDTMRLLLANVWKEADLIRTVDRIEGLIQPHLHTRQAGAPKVMKTVRRFIQTRRAVVEKELETWPVKIPPQPRKPMYTVPIGVARGSFATRFAHRPPDNIASTGSVTMEFQLDGQPVSFKTTGASLHRPRQGGFPFALGGKPAPISAKLNLVISGMRQSDEKPVSLEFSIDQQTLLANIGKPIRVEGYISGTDKGTHFLLPFGSRTVSGTLTLTRAVLEPDEPIEAQFDLSIFELRGAFNDQPKTDPNKSATPPAADAEQPDN